MAEFVKISELRRLELLLARQEATVREAFAAFVRTVRSPRVLREIRQLIAAGNIEGALNIVDAQIIRFASVVSQVFQTVGVSEITSLVRQLGTGRALLTAIVFDPTYPRAAELMRAARLSLIQQFTRTQRNVTRAALTEALRTGAGPVAAARAFRNSIGLTDTQYAAVESYRGLLEAGSADALNRALRDRRFDPTLLSTLDEGDVLGAGTITRMVERYRDNSLAMRSETIARTETQRVLNEARQEAVEQLTSIADIPAASVTRVWRATQDARTRDTHAAMEGQEVALASPFQSPSGALLMYPGDPSAPASEIINCRCIIQIVVE